MTRQAVGMLAFARPWCWLLLTNYLSHLVIGRMSFSSAWSTTCNVVKDGVHWIIGKFLVYKFYIPQVLHILHTSYLQAASIILDKSDQLLSRFTTQNFKLEYKQTSKILLWILITYCDPRSPCLLTNPTDSAHIIWSAIRILSIVIDLPSGVALTAFVIASMDNGAETTRALLIIIKANEWYTNCWHT